MGDVERRRRRVARGTGIALALLVALNVWSIAVGSAGSWSCVEFGRGCAYPTFAVVATSVAIVGEAAVLWAVLFSSGTLPSRQRAVLSLLLTLPAALLAFFCFATDQPSYETGHVRWLFEMTILAIGASLASALRALFARHRPKTTATPVP
jgi:hypothetical protein